MKYFWIILSGLAVLIVGLGFWYNSVVSQPLSDGPATSVLRVEKGDGVKVVADKLVEAKYLETRWHWNVYIFVTGRRSSILEGEYAVTNDMSIREIARLVTTAPTGPEEKTIKLLEGWTAENMADILGKADIVDPQEFLDAVEEADVTTLLSGKKYTWLEDKPASASLEGYLFPDTYKFFVDSTPAQVIGKMLENFDTRFSASLRSDLEKQDRSVFDMLTLASIVERELRTDRDRARAADLFMRRMEIGMALQSDATVNYVTGKSTPRASSADIQIDSPYNTYKYRGLPPGPIGNPSLSAIRATVNPEANEYFYFLSAPDGTTYWGRTLDEHNANVAKYLD